MISAIKSTIPTRLNVLQRFRSIAQGFYDIFFFSRVQTPLLSYPVDDGTALANDVAAIVQDAQRAHVQLLQESPSKNHVEQMRKTPEILPDQMSSAQFQVTFESAFAGNGSTCNG